MPSSLLADRRAGVSEAQAVRSIFLERSWWERWWFGLSCVVVRVLWSQPAWFAGAPPSASRSARSPPSPDHEEPVPLYDSWRYQSLDRARWLIISLLGTFWEAYRLFPHRKWFGVLVPPYRPHCLQLLCRRNRKYITANSRAERGSRRDVEASLP